ncbi:hypothetical protein JW835_04130 [bacterium]|nr:hypothetical protein [bacterium]
MKSTKTTIITNDGITDFPKMLDMAKAFFIYETVKEALEEYLVIKGKS